MILQPVLQPHIRPIVVVGEGVYLLSENSYKLIRGRLYEALLPLIDGTRTADEIADALQPEFPAARTYYALLTLARERCIIESAANLQDSGFWNLYGLDASDAADKLAKTTVSITAFENHVLQERLEKALRSYGITPSPEADLQVVLADDYLDSRLAAINREAVASGRSWLLAKPRGFTPWLGPLFHPHETGCWECLAHRLREHRAFELSLTRRDSADTAIPPCDISLTVQIACDILAAEVLKSIASGKQSSIYGKVLSVDTRTWQMETHLLVRRPQCRVCGLPEYRTEERHRPIELASRIATFTTDGGFRCAAPEKTVQQYRHHVSAITGVISALDSHERAQGAVRAYVAVNNLATYHGAVARSLPNYSGGKGITDSQARASALCEALERHSGVYQGYEASVRSTARELGDAAVHPNSCMLYSSRQYQHRIEINADGSRYHRVPAPFDEAVEIRWSPVWSLSRKEFRFLPTSYCYYGYLDQSEEPDNTGFCWACSNGTAAGNNPEEAILQGLLELIERDSVAIWWYNRLRRPRVDLSSCCDPYLHQLSAHYAETGRHFWVLDITSDLEIPVFAAVSSKEGGAGPLLLGFGCHLDPRIALLRAATEMNQFLLTTLAAEDDHAPSISGLDRHTVNWMRTATLDNQPHLEPDSEQLATRLGYPSQWQRPDIRDCILHCEAILEKRGLELLVLDQTRPDVGLPVVKVIVPGLRHFWPRFAPGRLYDIPVTMGWLPARRTEEELNPTAICF